MGKKAEAALQHDLAALATDLDNWATFGRELGRRLAALHGSTWWMGALILRVLGLMTPVLYSADLGNLVRELRAGPSDGGADHG